MSDSVFRVINVTKVPGLKKGRHKNGFAVHVKRKMIHPGRHEDFNELPAGVRGLQARKPYPYVRIELVKNISVEIKREIEETEKVNAANTKKALANARKTSADQKKAAADQEVADKKLVEATNQKSQPASSLDKDALKKQIKDGLGTPKAKVSGEGGEDPLADVEDSINPDGEPNFVVTAGKSKNRGQKLRS